jgi:very-short-patch-repair endonuclease
MLWTPDAVLVGRTAAALTFWPGLAVGDVEVAQVDDRRHRPGFTTSRRRVPPELVVRSGVLRLSAPALTAVDLCAEAGGEAIDVALRSRRLRLVDLEHALALTPGRRGNAARRRLLHDSRDEPWSAAERVAHRLLRRAGITGWRANHPVTARGRRYFVDLAFPGSRLVVEIDGRRHHSDAQAFEADRRRQNDLVLAGWRVLRFTWRMLEDEPAAVVAAIRSAL